MAVSRSGRLPHLLEKDVWIVWFLQHLFDGPMPRIWSPRVGTSLSKAYGVIRRFSEDVDLTYDIRAIAGDLVGDADAPLPVSKSQEKKWSKEIRARLPDWVVNEIVPRLKQDLEQPSLPASVRAENDKVFIDYVPLTAGTGYVAPAVMLEFGARSTSEPSEPRLIQCDAAAYLPMLVFPTAMPQVMRAERTFWEKATALGKAVADHKSIFFAEKSSHGELIDYHTAVSGGLQLVPDDGALATLASDYQHIWSMTACFSMTLSLSRHCCSNAESFSKRQMSHRLWKKHLPAYLRRHRQSIMRARHGLSDNMSAQVTTLLTLGFII